MTPKNTLAGIAWAVIVFGLFMWAVQLPSYAGKGFSGSTFWASFKAPIIIFGIGVLLRVFAEIIGLLTKIANQRSN